MWPSTANAAPIVYDKRGFLVGRTLDGAWGFGSDDVHQVETVTWDDLGRPVKIARSGHQATEINYRCD